MSAKIEKTKQFICWLLVICSLAFWAISISQANLPDLSFVPPFQRLGSLFWVGLFFVVINILMGSKQQKITSIVVLSFYFIVTLSVIFEFPIIHDSVINTTFFQNAEGLHELYGRSYIGIKLTLNAINWIFGSNAWDTAQYFPIGAGIIYLLILALFCYSWKDILFSSFFSSCLFALFFIAFGETFYLRINASPQTLAYIWFLFSLSIFPLANKFIPVKILLLLSISMMIISHPITPLLSIPGILAAIILTDKKKISTIITHAVEFVILVMVGYLTWTLYMGNWVIKQAVMIVSNALETEKVAPIVGNTPVTQIEITNYLFWHRILLISLLIILLILYLITIKSRVWLFATIWGIGLLPAFLLLFSYQDFFDRILLFGLVPCAVIFAEGCYRLLDHFQKIKLPVASLLVGLVLLSAYVAYFYVGAVDRITEDEVKANEYITSLNKPLKVYTDGFNLPAPERISYIVGNRGIIDINRAMQADVIIITKQMGNATLLNPRAPLQVSDFIKFIRQDYILAQQFGQVQVFIRSTEDIGNPID